MFHDYSLELVGSSFQVTYEDVEWVLAKEEQTRLWDFLSTWENRVRLATKLVYTNVLKEIHGSQDEIDNNEDSGKYIF